ncbi:MAG: histidine phosphatase family protein [Leptotrichia wadei]|uniref:histidine phosphatase family protein n=1 Tax=Leptotrichia wadei TaxID=157687 RepID=UPI0026EB18AC|nr:histidine phosphatase family protein [Leptotrichia wadei]MBS6019065.1 histidine phosphatase family protein [Leptotrichia wadei]
MAIFKDTTITDNGRALIADTLANNKQIIFTRMITSSKIYEDSTDVSKLTNIDEIKQTVSMSKISQEGTRVRLNAVFTNSAVNTSYKIQTIGLYAKTGTGNEILYSITRAKEPDVMPATNGINLATVEIDLITEINNSNGATMLMNPSTLVTTSNLVAELEKIAGLEFGGNIQDIGNKTKGKFYYDSVTKFYYECIEDNSLTYNDSGKFRAISNKPLSDKVENLFRDNKNGYLKLGNILIQWGSISVQQSKYTLVYPVPYKETPAITISTWDFKGTITHTGRSKTQCLFSSSAGNIGLDWITIGVI